MIIDITRSRMDYDIIRQTHRDGCWLQAAFRTHYNCRLDLLYMSLDRSRGAGGGVEGGAAERGAAERRAQRATARPWTMASRAAGRDERKQEQHIQQDAPGGCGAKSAAQGAGPLLARCTRATPLSWELPTPRRRRTPPTRAADHAAERCAEGGRAPRKARGGGGRRAAHAQHAAPGAHRPHAHRRASGSQTLSPRARQRPNFRMPQSWRQK